MITTSLKVIWDLTKKLLKIFLESPDFFIISKLF